MQPTKEQKIATLKGANVDVEKALLETINILYEEYLLQQRIKDNEVDKTTPKYLIALQLINKILHNLGKPAIDDLTKFQKIDRLDIIKKVNYDTIEEMEDEIYKHFDKIKCGYYRKRNTYPMTLIKGMCRELELDFTYKQKVVTKNSSVKTHMMYSINFKNI